MYIHEMKIHSHTEDKHCTTESMKARRRLLFFNQTAATEKQLLHYATNRVGLFRRGWRYYGDIPYYNVSLCRLKPPFPDALD